MFFSVLLVLKDGIFVVEIWIVLLVCGLWLLWVECLWIEKVLKFISVIWLLFLSVVVIELVNVLRVWLVVVLEMFVLVVIWLISWDLFIIMIFFDCYYIVCLKWFCLNVIVSLIVNIKF